MHHLILPIGIDVAHRRLNYGGDVGICVNIEGDCAIIEGVADVHESLEVTHGVTVER